MDHSARPKRILALSGGGVRGIVEVAFLEAVEAEYRSRYGQDTRLCDHFDLIGGSSTGALIATALALGKPLSEIRDFYLDRATAFFSRRYWWRFGRAPLFDCAGLEAEIRRDIGDLTLGDPAFRSYLAIVTKRLDTGSPWIVNNIPTAPYYDDCPDEGFIGNRHYQVARLLRAATAAPTLFSQQTLRISPDCPPGVFVDGGLSPHNDPAFVLFQLSQIGTFGLRWPATPESLFILSIGAGRFRRRIPPALARTLSPVRLAYESLIGMISDCEVNTLTTMQWLGQSRAPAVINSEIGTLEKESPHGAGLFSYLRLDLPLEAASLSQLGIDMDTETLTRYRSLDNPGIIQPLYELTQTYAKKALELNAWLI